MSKLIKNELIKIFKKKTIYIALIAVLLLLIFMNCILKFSGSSSNEIYAYTEEQIGYLKEDLSKLDPKKSSDTSMYIELKSTIDTNELMLKYSKDAWQRDIIESNISTYIQQKNTYEYGTDKDSAKVEELNEIINNLIAKLDNDDWKYFANEELDIANKNLQELEEQRVNTSDKQLFKDLEVQIENAKIEKEVAEYRVNEEIKYGNDYLNKALSRYKNTSQDLIQLEIENKDKENMEYIKKQQYNENLEQKEVNKYILENKVDVNKNDSLKGILENFYNQLGIFMLAVIIMVAATIVSDEFNKGTIKLLLVKPYSRTKILLAKFLTTVIMTVFIISITILMQVLIGGILFGFDSLSLPVIEYNFNTNSIQIMNIFAYLGIQTLAQLPMIILLATLAFVISTIFSNSALAIIISLLGYMANSVINQLAIMYNLGFMKYFVTMNWDLSQYLFGGLPYMEGMTFIGSILINIVYFLILIIPTILIFKKRNIKNI